MSIISFQYYSKIILTNMIKNNYLFSSKNCFIKPSNLKRYCASMEQNVCGVLYPNYEISQIDPDISQFQCSLRLPPNSVLNKTITVSDFSHPKKAEKKIAKNFNFRVKYSQEKNGLKCMRHY